RAIGDGMLVRDVVAMRQSGRARTQWSEPCFTAARHGQRAPAVTGLLMPGRVGARTLARRGCNTDREREGRCGRKAFHVTRQRRASAEFRRPTGKIREVRLVSA